MTARSTVLRFLLTACLAAAVLVLASWAFLDRSWFAHPFLRWQTAVLAGGFLGFFLLALTLAVQLDRRRAALAENTEAKFRSLLEAAPDPIVIMSGDGIVTLVNARAEQLFGYPRAEILGVAVDVLLSQSSAEGSLPLDSSLAAYPGWGTQPGDEPPAIRARRKDGTWVPVELSFSPLETREGLRTISIIRDITERKKVERLRSARHAVRRILAEGTDLADVAPRLLQALCEALRLDVGMLWVVDAAAGVLRYADSWYVPALPGLSFQEASRPVTYACGAGRPGRAWADGRSVWADDAGAPAVTVVARAEEEAAQGLREAFAFPVLFGAEVLGVIECFRRDPQDHDEALCETLHSIGSQIGRFLKHRQAEDAVRESEARKAAILEAAVDAIITLDRAGRIIEWNPAAERIFGLARAEAVGEEMARLLLPAPGQSPTAASRSATCESILSGCLGSSGASPRGERSELTLARRDGTEIPVELAVTRIPTDGLPLFTCYIRDLTERRRAEEALQRVEENLRQAQKMEAVGRLAGGVAHDFNNILTVITGYTHMLLGVFPPETAQRNAVESIAKSATRAAALTRQLLAFSRRQVMAPRSFDLNSTVADMGKMLLRLIGEDIDLITVPANDLRPIKADPGQVEQVLMNLVVNARDAMPQGGKLTIETRNVELDATYAQTHPEVRAGSYVMMAISDTGHGMDEATRERIFEPFFTTKEVGKGTGLGLSTVYGIVKQSGGHIAVYSEPGKGSTFKIYLPSTREKPMPSHAGIRQMPLPAPCGKGTILLVEDEDMVRSLSGDILRQHGYTVREARHGLEALELNREELEGVDLTVTDVVMPEMNGRDLAQQLLGRKPSMKVLYVSGYTDNAVLRNGLLEPGAAFLEKPFSPDSLARKVHELLSA